MEKELLEIIAIDESGITSPYGFSVYAFVFIYVRDYVSISQYILQTEKESNLNYIHRQEMSWKTRFEVAKKLSTQNFHIFGVVYQNPINQSKKLEQSLLHISLNLHHTSRIFIDGKKGKMYKKHISTLLRKHVHSTCKVKFSNSISEPVLRLADFIAGSIRSYLDDTSHRQSNEIYKTFKNKIIKLHNIK